MAKKRWTQEELDFLLSNYGPMCSKQIAAAIGRSHWSVQHKLFRCGLKMTEEDLRYHLGSHGKSGSENPNWRGGGRTAYEQKCLDRKRHYHKHRAREILKAAIKAGRITRGCCVECGSPKSEGHHEDYTKPLEVVWLCRKHHIEHHKLLVK